jgi:uncharacterized protein YxeA
MKKKLTRIIESILLILLPVLFSHEAFGQDQQMYYVRIRLNDIQTLEQQQLITDFIRSKPGITMCRTDRRTDVLFALFEETVNLENFELWLDQLGVEVICWVHGTTENTSIEELPCNQVTIQNANPVK